MKREASWITQTVVALYVVLCSGYALSTVYGYTTALLTIGIILSVLLMVLKRDWLIPYDLRTLACICFVLMIVFSMICNQQGDSRRYLNYVFSCLVAYAISKNISARTFYDYFSKAMVWITAISLVGYYLVNYTTLLSGLPRMINSNESEYTVGYIFNYITRMPERNCGVFWEPGVFASFLCTAMLYEILFSSQKIRVLRIVLFSVGIYTANSSAGFALWAVCMISLLTKRKNSQEVLNLRSILSAIVFGCALFAIANVDSIISMIIFKNNPYLAKLSSEHIASSERGFAFTHNIGIFAEHPLFGAGFKITDSLMQHYADTSTTTYFMSLFGIMGVSYTVFWIIAVLRQKKLNLYSKILVLIVILSIINKEPHGLILFTWCTLFYLLSTGRNKDACRNSLYID